MRTHASLPLRLFSLFLLAGAVLVGSLGGCSPGRTASAEKAEGAEKKADATSKSKTTAAADSAGAWNAFIDAPTLKNWKASEIGRAHV